MKVKQKKTNKTKKTHFTDCWIKTLISKDYDTTEILFPLPYYLKIFQSELSRTKDHKGHIHIVKENQVDRVIISFKKNLHSGRSSDL